jgi:DNA polymerase-1
VPGIGVKTAAQLIGEYGNLETLLKRAGEIKQEKRRQTLIENAEKARVSKQLVTLDDHVKLEVPIADLAVHEPDYPRLVAFLKAMEFSSLLRRVVEFSGVDANEVEADESLAGHRGGLTSPPPARARERDAAQGELLPLPPSPTLPLKGGGSSMPVGLPTRGGH